MLTEELKSAIRDVEDFPKKGIIFKDITPIFQNVPLCEKIISAFQQQLKEQQIDAVAAVESRGFLFGFLLAQKLNVPFIPIRKSGKLPYQTISREYDLEYGKAKIEMHVDAIKKNWNVLIHDDLLATGGTAAAAAELIKMQEGNVAGFAFLVELKFLNGNNKLTNHSNNIISLVKY